MGTVEFVFVLGTVRSGVALASDCLHFLFRDALHPQNKTLRYFNHATNENFLKSTNSTSRIPFLIPHESTYPQNKEALKKHLSDAFTENHFPGKTFIILSDSLLCFSLELWVSLLCELNIPSHFIHTIRHPHEVAVFLEKEKNVPLLKGHLIWLEYIRNALKNLKKKRVSTITFDQLLADPVTTMNRCCASIGTPPIHHEHAQGLLDYIQPGLKNHCCVDMRDHDRKRFFAFSEFYEKIRATTAYPCGDLPGNDTGEDETCRHEDESVAIDSTTSFLDFAFEAIHNHEEKERRIQDGTEIDQNRHPGFPPMLHVSLPLGHGRHFTETIPVLPAMWQKIVLPVTHPFPLNEQPVFVQFSNVDYLFEIHTISIKKTLSDEVVWSLSGPSEMKMLRTEGPFFVDATKTNPCLLPLVKDSKIVINPLWDFPDAPLELEMWIKPDHNTYCDQKFVLHARKDSENKDSGDKDPSYSKSSEADRLVRLAQQFRLGGDVLAAEIIASKVLAWKPNHIPALKEYAEIFAVKKNAAEVFATCKKIYSQIKNEVDERTMVLLVMFATVLKKFHEAETFLAAGLKLFSGSKALLQESARLAMARSQWDKAIATLTRLSKTHPNCFECAGLLAACYESTQNYANAIAYSKKAVALSNAVSGQRQDLDRVLSKYSSVVTSFCTDEKIFFRCPICFETSCLHVAPYPANSLQEPFFSKLSVIFCGKCGSGYVPGANNLLQEYYKSEYAETNRKDRDIPPKIYFGKDARRKFPSVRYYFNRADAHVRILKNFGAVFGKVLDYGSGPGYFLKACQAGEAFAVDPDNHSEKYLRHIDAKTIDKDSLPQDFFDVIVASHVVEHFDADEAASLLKNMLLSLKNDGLLLIEVPQGGHTYLLLDHAQHSPHSIFFTPEGLMKLLRNCGAQILASFPRLTSTAYRGRKSTCYTPDPDDPFFSTDREGLTVIVKRDAASEAYQPAMRPETKNQAVCTGAKYGNVNQGNFQKYGCRYPVSYERFRLATEFLMSLPASDEKRKFLDLGGRDSRIAELNRANKNFASAFKRNFSYFCLDIDEYEGVLVADVCDQSMLQKHPELSGGFDVLYSNNTFEHLSNPFVAAHNVYRLLRSGGHGILFAPFSWRYHEAPVDYFRYSHTGLVNLFQANADPIEVLESGFDITERRKNLQGYGYYKGAWVNDICPEDELGAWREQWQSILIFRKPWTASDQDRPPRPRG